MKMKMNLILSATFILVASTAQVSAQPTIRANPNPIVVPVGQTQSTTTLTWNTEGAAGYVWLSIDGGEDTQITRGGTAVGTLGASGELGKSYEFKLYTADKQQLLASVTVAGQQAAPQPPPVTPSGHVVFGRKSGSSKDAVIPAESKTVDLSSQVVTAGKNSDRAAEVLLPRVLPRVPYVVGLSNDSANHVLSLAGFYTKTTYLDRPVQSVAYDHVAATIPIAGTLAPKQTRVEIQIPRPVSRPAIGHLSLNDFVRRDGFDLDEGRYEEIFRGADMVLRQDNNPITNVDSNGHKYLTAKGTYFEPSDGAFFALDIHSQLRVDDLGFARNYTVCAEQLQQQRQAYINVNAKSETGAGVTFCVLTSKRQIAVVQIRNGENSLHDIDYKFYTALFPLQLETWQRTPINK